MVKIIPFWFFERDNKRTIKLNYLKQKLKESVDQREIRNPFAHEREDVDARGIMSGPLSQCLHLISLYAIQKLLFILESVELETI